MTEGSKETISLIYGFSGILELLAMGHTAGCLCDVSASLVKSALPTPYPSSDTLSLAAASKVPLPKLRAPRNTS